MRKSAIALLSFILIYSGVAAPSSATPHQLAQATASFRIAWTHIGIYPKSATSIAAPRIGSALPDGALVSVSCELLGTSVTSDAGTSRIWERLTNGSYIPNVFVNTGFDGWTPGVPRCPGKYSRFSAVGWALANVSSPERFAGNDCTWFVTQALWEGSVPKTSDWDGSGDLNAINADYFKNYLTRKGLATIHELAWSDSTAGRAQYGDVILYDWNGRADGIVDHVAIVTSYQNRQVIISQHSPARAARQWNLESDGRALSSTRPGSRVYVLRIAY